MICNAVYFPGSLKVFLCVCTALAVWFAWHEPRGRIWRIAVNGQAWAAVFVGREAFAATLCAGSLVSVPVCFLKWRVMGKTRWQCVLPDMADAEDYRRLRVWAKWVSVRLQNEE